MLLKSKFCWFVATMVSTPITTTDHNQKCTEKKKSIKKRICIKTDLWTEKNKLNFVGSKFDVIIRVCVCVCHWCSINPIIIWILYWDWRIWAHAYSQRQWIDMFTSSFRCNKIVSDYCSKMKTKSALNWTKTAMNAREWEWGRGRECVEKESRVI